ncbi:uncharacterized protein MELLADRAFT_110082 [Melampsora larici-populina 98AG31]|uniref:Uncharacterized protein n=1 Tax=Melampsora larici-populina (strain 98AG31 / pathotype 3-4-7) TaxID=747676 RepID=F4RYL3_MELLP|nr:uncharacterized protein MELLADRAFT_110082 [Melampsora larici-populina 98AG31]EGG02493.1 hypothetical protein MELLADRAFT_110082 [Melampsora larici-populina 98AG31]
MLPMGWWLDSLPDLLKGEVHQLVEELVKGVHLEIMTNIFSRFQAANSGALTASATESHKISPRYGVNAAVQKDKENSETRATFHVTATATPSKDAVFFTSEKQNKSLI